jgi:hypothetical protein
MILFCCCRLRVDKKMVQVLVTTIRFHICDCFSEKINGGCVH